MTDPLTMVSAAVVLLCLIVAFMSMTIPFLWWTASRISAKMAELERMQAEARRELDQLDEVVDKLARLANIEGR
jgi:hypothetical protein